MPRAGALSLLATLLAASPARAQDSPADPCTPSGVEGVGEDRAAPGAGQAFRDGVVREGRIDVSRLERDWDERTVAVGAGVTGTRPARWAACAGAWVGFQAATMVVEGASGEYHFRASLAPLLEVLRRREGTPRENPRRENP